MSIEPLPGDSWALRRSVDDLRSTLADLATARQAAVHLDRVAEGVHWRGGAFDAFKASTERKPLPAALDRATDGMVEAAESLRWFADRFDTNAETIRWCRARLATGGLDPAEVARVEHRAGEARQAHHDALAVVAATFDRLDDATTFATPPPSNFDKVRGAVGDLVGGLGEACVDLAKLGAELSLYTFPVTAPHELHDLWGHRQEAMAVARYAWEHPGDFGTELGKALIDFETWTEDGIARWVGKRIPDIVLTLATGGAGVAARIPAVLDDVGRLGAAVLRVMGRLRLPAFPSLPALSADDLLLKIPTIERMATLSRTATARFVAGDVVAFTVSQRTALAAVVGAQTVNRLATPVAAYRDLAGAASEGP